MKKPSKKEVKQYFKNALTVDSPVGSFDGKIKLKSIRWYDQEKEKYIVCDCNNAVGVITLWSHTDGFSKILTYKDPKEESFTDEEKYDLKKAQFMLNNHFELKKFFPEIFQEETFTITKSEIDLYIEKHPCCGATKDTLRDLFPSAFEPEEKELVVGVWYKSNIGTLAFYSGNEENYGISTCGNWNYQLITKTNWNKCESGIWTEATHQEVEEALKAEILKRYKVGDLVYLWDSEGETKKLLLDEFKYYPKDNQMLVSTEDNRMAKMFDNGIFAEIIQPKKMTKAEIETELGYNIEIV